MRRENSEKSGNVVKIGRTKKEFTKMMMLVDGCCTISYIYKMPFVLCRFLVTVVASVCNCNVIEKNI
jgi:hypothetical protein